MVSAVQHKTRTALAKAKRSGLGRIGKNKKTLPPMGITFSEPYKDIATDTLVRRTVLGRKPGTDVGFDRAMFMAVAMGGAAVYLTRGSPFKEKRILGTVLGAGAIITGLSHFIDYEVKLPKSRFY